MNIHFEIRKKNKHHNLLILRGTVDDFANGHKEMKALLEKEYPLESHLHTFWTEETEAKIYKFN